MYQRNPRMIRPQKAKHNKARNTIFGTNWYMKFISYVSLSYTWAYLSCIAWWLSIKRTTLINIKLQIISFDSHMAMRWCTKRDVAKETCPIVFQGHPPNFKVARPKKSSILIQIGRFWTVATLWIHWRLWNDAKSLKQHRRSALLFSKVIYQISRSYGTKNHQFWSHFGRFQTANPPWIHWWLWNDTQSLKKAEDMCIVVFQGHLSIFKIRRTKNCQLWSGL